MNLKESFFLIFILLSVSSIFLAVEVSLAGLKDKLQNKLYGNEPSIIIYIVESLIHLFIVFCFYKLGWTTVLKFIPFVYASFIPNALNVHICILEESKKVYISGLILTLVMFSF